MKQYREKYIFVIVLFAAFFTLTLSVWAEEARSVYTNYSGTHEVDFVFFRSSVPAEEVQNYTRYSGTHEIDLVFFRPSVPAEEAQSYTRYSGTHEVDLSFGPKDSVDSDSTVSVVEVEEVPQGDGATTAYIEEERPRGDGGTTAYVEEEIDRRGDGATTAYTENEEPEVQPAPEHPRQNLAFTTRPYVVEGNAEGIVEEPEVRPAPEHPRQNLAFTTRPYVVEGLAESVIEELPEVQPAPPVRRSPETVRIASVKLLQVRETSRGGSLPFDVTDVEQEIAPKGIRENQTSSVNPVTCGNQRFPVGAGMTNSPMLFRFPDAGGACEIGLAVSNGAEVAFTITSASASTATVAGMNGWSANLAHIAYGIGGTVADTIILSRNGVSYTMGIEAEGTGAGSFPIYINVTSFSGPN